MACLRAMLLLWSAAALELADGQEEPSNSKMAAVDKVISMLEKLQTQVAKEGEEEAKTYDKFACFCKDATAEKNDAITTNQDAKNELEADIQNLQSSRVELDSSIEELVEAIKAAEAELEKAAEERKAALQAYETNAADLTAALQALEGAIGALKASKPSLAQFHSAVRALRRATSMAEALGFPSADKASKAVSTFLQQPSEDYEFHSDSIIETLEKLLKDFQSQKESIDAAEVESQKEHDAFVQEKEDFVKSKNGELDDAKKQKEEAKEEIASQSQRLSTTSATLLEDVAYLKELGIMCHKRAITWDQRTETRAGELNALTQAIAIIKGAVSEKTTEKTARLLQKHIDIRIASVVSRDEESMEAIEAAAEAADGYGEETAPSLFQLSAKPRKLLAAMATKRVVARSPQQAIANLLLKEGDRLKSALLTRLATQVAKDPFAKVKKLIQELIERLLAESAEEANQKGWCDKAMGDATQKRDHAAKAIGELNSKMAKLEAVRDELAEELEVLTKELGELEAQREKATKLRDAEKGENAATVEEAQAGLEALAEAKDILEKYYKTAAKSKVSELQRAGAPSPSSPRDDAPDAGFGDGEAYTGAQGSAKGIIGMLEVIQSDFERTVSETQKAEASAEKDYQDLMTETGKSLAEKNVASDEKTKQKDDAEANLSEANENLHIQTSLLAKSIEELIELKPACVDTGMSYEDRVALREQEIAALKKALCIFENYETYGPDGAADAC